MPGAGKDRVTMPRDDSVHTRVRGGFNLPSSHQLRCWGGGGVEAQSGQSTVILWVQGSYS